MKSAAHHQGLSEQQVLENRTRYGINILTPPEKEPLWKQFLEKFSDPIIKILLVALLLSVGVAFYQFFTGTEPASVFLEPAGILAAILLATCVGFAFEVSANKKFEILNQVNDDTMVQVIRGGNICELPRRDVVVGDIVILNTGEEVPADGVLLEAVSLQVNESTLTGEPLIGKTTDEEEFKKDATYPSNHVLKGTTVADGHGVMEVTSVGDRTEYGKVYEGSQIDNKVQTPLNRQLSRLGDLITWASYAIAAFIVIGRLTLYFSHLPGPVEWLSAGTYILNTVMIAVTVIVVTVPEGLPMSVTLSLALSMKSMLANNNLVRKMHACETMGAATVICTDKTGTLTEGEPRVVAVLPEEGMDADALVEMAAALEQGSEHPVGKAVYEHARLLNLPVRAVADLSVVPGRGIAGTVDGVPYAVGNSGFMQDKGISWKEDESRLREFMRQGASPLYVGRGGCPAGVIMVADSLKPDSRAAVDSLKRMNLRVVMLTGDNAATARHMAGELHIDEVVSDVLPDEKASHVMKMEERGDKVAMVGDGVNDAPALACARVGISMKSGTELAMESSDIVLMKSNPAGVAEAVQLGRTTLLIIRQNLFWAFFYNIIGIPLAAGCLYPAFGLTLNPMIAAGAMSLSSLCVVFNSLRLRGFTPRLGRLGK